MAKPPDAITPPSTVKPQGTQSVYAGSLLGLSKAFVDAFKDDTNLQEAYKAYLKGNFTDFETLFLASNFYKDNTKSAQERMRGKAEQPGAYTKTLDAFKLSIQERLAAKGLDLDIKYFDSKEFETAYLNGLNADHFDKLFNESDFYKSNTALAQERKLSKTRQPGAYKQEFEDYKLSTIKRLKQTGVTLDDAYINSPEFENAYLDGISDTEFDKLVVKSGKTGDIGGSISGNIQGLKVYANSLGVGGNHDWKQYSQDLFAGNTTIEDIKTLIRDSASGKSGTVGGSIGGDIADLKTYANSFGVGNLQNWEVLSKGILAETTNVDDIRAKILQDAMSAYPAYADSIGKGISLDVTLSANKSMMASVLERDQDTISWADPVLLKAAQYVDAAGKPAVMPLWLFNKELKKTEEWAYTNNARDSFDSKTNRVFSDMGLI